MLAPGLGAEAGDDAAEAGAADDDRDVDGASTTGVGSSLTLVVPLVVTAGRATEYGDVDGAFDASSIPSCASSSLSQMPAVSSKFTTRELPDCPEISR